MFFTWYSENRHFKSGSEIKGQIAPFLIVIMVILLIAALATINIGRVGIDKTYSANAADAGALASASAYASAFNALAENNNTLYNIYAANRVVMKDFYDEAMDNLDYAIIATATTLALAIAGYAIMWYEMPIGAPEMLYYYGYAAWCYFGAEVASIIANSYMAKYGTAVSFMRSLVDSHYTTAKDYYCSLVDAMDTAQTDSSDVGYGYAFSNSGISSKLSTGQQSAFSDWLDAESYTSGHYEWQDKLNQQHRVTVNVSVPGIDTYVLQKTNYNYSKECDILDDCISTAETLCSILGGLTLTFHLLWPICNWLSAESAAAFVLYWVGWALIVIGTAMLSNPWTAAAGAALIAAGYALQAEAYAMTVWIWVWWIVAQALATAAIVLLIYILVEEAALQDKTDDAYYGFMMDGNFSSSGCGDVDDILIVKMDDVIPSSWETECCSQQSHPGTSSGLFATSYPTVNSCAKASFAGGDVGSFTATYTSKLTSAN